MPLAFNDCSLATGVWQKQGLHSLLVGLRIPEVPLYELGPDNKPVEVNPRDLFAGKLGILCGVPGAFTPVCTGVSPFPMVFMQLTNSFKPVTEQRRRSLTPCS